jgi:acyl carrier protein
MNNVDLLRRTFAESLGIKEEVVRESLEYNKIPEWDSVAHMILITAIEGRFDLMLDTDDILGMSSFGKALEILKKYGVEV